jgi:hypothetical protein
MSAAISRSAIAGFFCHTARRRGIITSILIPFDTQTIDASSVEHKRTAGREHMEAKRAPGIARIVTKYGLIQGVVSAAVSVIGTLAAIKPSWAGGVLTTALLVVLIVLAHREFKNTHNGVMAYGEGLWSGTLLSIIAAAVGAIFLYVYVQYFNTNFFATAIRAQQALLAQRGITGAQAQQAMGIVGAVMTPVGIAVSSLISGVIIGFVVALIASIFTQSATARS